MLVKKLLILLLLVVVLANDGATATLQIKRGPYLQLHRAGTTTIRYRTNAKCDSLVRYGTNPALLNLFVYNPEVTKDHELEITGLDTWKTYYYSIETSTEVLAAGPDYRFLTSPDDHHQGVVQRFWILGDSGTGDDNARAVRDAYMNFIGAEQPGLIFLLGNSALPLGKKKQFDTALFKQYPDLLKKAGLMPVLGEADTRNSKNPKPKLSYFKLFTLPAGAEGGGVPSGTEKYYSYNYGIIHFIGLDSQASDRSPTGPMLTWLNNDLAANTYPWTIAFFHHSPYSKGNHDSDAEQEMAEMRAHVLPILEANGVDLVLSAHSNSYERSFFLNGHYGPSNTLIPGMILNAGNGRPVTEGGDGAYFKPAGANNAGTVYAVVGSSGFVAPAPLNHPAMHIGLAQLGSMAIDLLNNRLNAKFIRPDGTVGDSFTIVKNNQPPSVTLTSPPNGAVYTRPTAVTISADISDPDTNIRWVEFVRDTSILFRAWDKPFSYTWTPEFAGTYQIYIRAMDELGAITLTPPVTITIK